MTLPFIVPDWTPPPGVHAGTTLRDGGVSAGACRSLNLGDHVADDPDSVAENRRRFIAGCGLPGEPMWLRQTHGINVASDAPDDPDPGTDAIVTREANRVCIVMTADCLPVAFAARDGGEIGLAHAGWRGLAGGILEATLGRMRTPPGQLQAWLGPAISQAAFEVGHEVKGQFVARCPDAAAFFAANERGRLQADLYGLARLLLERAGVTRVSGGQHCTFNDAKRFFSYRRDGQCGRMGTFIYRRRSA